MLYGKQSCVLPQNHVPTLVKVSGTGGHVRLSDIYFKIPHSLVQRAARYPKFLSCVTT